MTSPKQRTHWLACRVGAALMRVRPAPVAVALKNLLGIRRIEIPSQEGTFWLDPASEFGQRLLTIGSCEPELVATMHRLLRPGNTFADIGANEGYFSVVAARLVGPTGRVLAIEPQNRLQEVLHRNFALNAAHNVTLVRSAVSDAAGVAELNLAPSMNTGATSLMRRTRYALERETVPLRTLTDIFSAAGLERIDLLKMDIEGWEYEAILGSPALFASGAIRAISLELHPDHLRDRGLDAQRIVDFLQGCGYRYAADFETIVFLRTDAP